jgi:hypothetical protein
MISSMLLEAIQQNSLSGFTLHSAAFIGRLSSFTIGPKSSRDPLRLRSWSNELVRERLAFIKMVLPPRYWLRNSLRFSAVSWVWRDCFPSQCARSSIMRNSFCSRRLDVSTPRNLVNITDCSSSGNNSSRWNMVVCVRLSFRPEIDLNNWFCEVP